MIDYFCFSPKKYIPRDIFEKDQAPSLSLSWRLCQTKNQMKGKELGQWQRTVTQLIVVAWNKNKHEKTFIIIFYTLTSDHPQILNFVRCWKLEFYIGNSPKYGRF